MTETLTKHVTQDDMTLYSGPGNIHSDVEVARRTGLDAPIAQGMQTLAFASELMTRVRGAQWLERGEISVKFTKPVFAERHGRRRGPRRRATPTRSRRTTSTATC